MYESYFGLEKPPFATIPDPEFLYLSPQHQRALSLLEYSILSRAGFCVITGDVGTGKTTLVRRMMQRVQGLELGLVSNTQCDSFEEFLQWILLAFDLDYHNKTKVELYDTFMQFLLDCHAKGVPVSLVIDEAQNLGPDYLEQLRMLSNVNTEKGQILQTVLVGQPELWDLLRRPDLAQFAQRISFDYHLHPLDSVKSVGEYIRHRLTLAGGNPDTFDEDAIAMIAEATRGVPRLINLVCDTCLVYGYAEQQQIIGSDIVEAVLQDKRSGFAEIGSRVQSFEDEHPAAQWVGRNQAANGRPSTIERAASKRRKR